MGERNGSGAGHGHQGTPERYSIRCAWIDYDRASNDANESHWRCPAWFPFEPEQDTHMQAHCPMHRTRPSPYRATREEFDRAMARFFARQERMADVANGHDEAAAMQRKSELRQQAIEAGLLPREPGEDDA